MAYQKVYMNQIHSSSLLCQLAQMWRSEVLCDAYIKTGNVVTKAHRVVLMAACPMLQSMDGATVGSQLEIKLAADIFKDSVKTFLQYLYDGFMMLTEDNVKDVEKIARLLQVENVIKCCADFYKTLERVTGGSNFSSSQYKYSFQDQLEFKHVRATDIHRAMQNGSEKRPADAEEFRRKRTRGESFSPSLSPRHTTDDSSFMLSSYTSSDAQRTSQNLGRVKPGFPASQTQGRHVVEDSFEMVQSDLDPNKSSREKGGTSARPQQTVSVTVASQINPTPDVQIITIPDVSEADRPTGASGTSSSRQSIFSAAAAASKSPNFSFGGNLSSPVRTSIPPGPSQSDRTSSTFTGPKGPRFTLGSSSRSETITSSSVYSSKESSSSTSQSKSSTMTTGSASDSKAIEIDAHPEQIIITPMAIDLPIVPTSAISEPMKPSFVSFIESESHGRISPTPEIEALSKQERTVSSAPVSVHDESNSSQPSSTPDLTIVKVETSPGPTTIQESDVPSLDMHVDVQPEDVEGIDDDGDDDGSDLEMYGYSDLSQGDSFGPGRSDQNNSWYIQTLKDLKERTGDGGFGSGPGPGGMGGPTAGPSSLQPRPTPPRGLQIDYANYVIVEHGKPVPQGYRLLAPGAIVAVPEMWYELTMSRCKGKSASYTLTAVTNGLIRPWEVRKGGTSAYDGTPLEPVIDALKLFGKLLLCMPPHKVVQTLNKKFVNHRRALKNMLKKNWNKLDSALSYETS
ncbi:hypothetical protein ACJMK2_019598 [Sinanodonta woodiana]|uniref:BTB domain-containing protein n=1 Tax=Sinanodonta woodiana TaxID=1069815 RepID=A0ABD3TW93_SINWO